jgi:hypothetical protein
MVTTYTTCFNIQKFAYCVQSAQMCLTGFSDWAVAVDPNSVSRLMFIQRILRYEVTLFIFISSSQSN